MGALDRVVADLARRQHGAVTSAQLAAIGMSRDAIKHRVAHERLTPLHRGVYLVGPLSDALTSPMAAVLACGPTAALSHRAAAALHGIRPEWPSTLDVTVAKGQPRTRKGIRVRRRPLEAHEVTVVEGIRATTVTRTIADLAEELDHRELRRTIEEAQIQNKLDHLSLAAAVDERRGRRGAMALRAAAQTAEPTLTRSEAERRLQELIRAAGLPRPITNAKVAGYEVDVLWRTQRLIVEVDGFAFHSHRTAFERTAAATPS